MTKQDTKYRLKGLFSTILYWITAFFLFDLIRNAGVSGDFDWLISLEVVLLTGGVTGIIYYLLESLLDREWTKRKSYGFRLLLKNGLFVGIFLIDILMGAELLAWVYDLSLSEEISILWSGGLIPAFLIYFTLCSLFYSFWKIVQEKYGPGVFWKMLFGLYTPPRKEKKIFMFLDMRGSTTIAEQLASTYSVT